MEKSYRKNGKSRRKHTAGATISMATTEPLGKLINKRYDDNNKALCHPFDPPFDPIPENSKRHPNWQSWYENETGQQKNPKIKNQIGGKASGKQ